MIGENEGGIKPMTIIGWHKGALSKDAKGTRHDDWELLIGGSAALFSSYHSVSFCVKRMPKYVCI